MKPHGHRYAGTCRSEPKGLRRHGSLFSSPSPPALPPEPPPPPAPDDPAIEEARRRRRLAEARRRGRQATILTGGEGDTTEATVSRPQLRTLLGGG